MSDEVAELEGEEEPQNTGEVVEPEESTTSDTEETAAEPEEKPKGSRGVQKRLDELTGNWRGEQRRNDQLQQQLQELTSLLAKSSEPAEAKQSEPVLEDFSSYEEFVDARATYQAERTVEAKLSEIEEKQQAAQASAEQATVRQQFEVRAKAFAEDHADFEEVAFNSSLPVTQDMASLLDVSEKGPEILYHLGQNPDESYRISQLPPGQAAMELGRIEAQLSVLQPNTRTGAPDPIEPISEGTGGRAKDPEKMTTEEWMTWRNAQLENKA